MMLCPPRGVPLLALLFSAANAEPCETDVVVVGAGFSGLAAGKTLIDAGLTNFFILESTDRIGGRVKSKTDFGLGSNKTIEEGANWIFPGTPIFDLVQNYNLDFTLQDFFNYDVYEYNQGVTAGSGFKALPIPKRTVDASLRAFRRDALRNCLYKASAEFFKPNGSPPDYIAALQYLSETCAWVMRDNLDFFNHWIYIQYEFADGDATVSEVFDPYRRGINGELYLVVDQKGGFEQVARKFADDNSISSHIKFGQRVTAIKYDETGDYAARVFVEGTTCTEYLAKRVILTVPAGVLNNNLIEFVPQLRYSEFEYNPFKVGDYIKVFYEFKKNFWGNTLKKEFLVSLQQKDNIGKCHHWQNLEADINRNPRLGTSTRFLPGSNILFCTLIRPAFRALLEETGEMELNDMQLQKLLDPLRRVFGSAVIDSNFISVFYPRHNLNQDYGYGSYSNWVPGYSQDDYFKFYGVGTAKNCEHNGCNEDGKWILHISGTCSCYEHWEMVHGAYYSGKRSANLVLHDLGYIEAVPASECEDFFRHPPWTPT